MRFQAAAGMMVGEEGKTQIEIFIAPQKKN
jgi:hypothetical protein